MLNVDIPLIKINIMTYLEKLLQLNNKLFKKANELLVAKALLAELPTGNYKIKTITEKINNLFVEYQQALVDSKNLLFYIKLNHINLETNLS